MKIKSTPEAQAKREKASNCAKQNKYHHYLGQLNYEDARKLWIKEGFYPACTDNSSTGSTSSTSVISDINLGDDWFCSRHKKDPTTGKRFIANKELKL